jgi:hypothetical protein
MLRATCTLKKNNSGGTDGGGASVNNVHCFISFHSHISVAGFVCGFICFRPDVFPKERYVNDMSLGNLNSLTRLCLLATRALLIPVRLKFTNAR